MLRLNKYWKKISEKYTGSHGYGYNCSFLLTIKLRPLCVVLSITVNWCWQRHRLQNTILGRNRLVRLKDLPPHLRLKSTFELYVGSCASSVTWSSLFVTHLTKNSHRAVNSAYHNSACASPPNSHTLQWVLSILIASFHSFKFQFGFHSILRIMILTRQLPTSNHYEYLYFLWGNSP